MAMAIIEAAKSTGELSSNRRRRTMVNSLPEFEIIQINEWFIKSGKTGLGWIAWCSKDERARVMAEEPADHDPEILYACQRDEMGRNHTKLVLMALMTDKLYWEAWMNPQEFKTIREALGWDVGTVAEQLRTSQSQLVAVEDGTREPGQRLYGRMRDYLDFMKSKVQENEQAN